jgi:hypothetical protein
MKQARKQHPWVLYCGVFLASALMLSSRAVAQNVMLNGALHGTVTDSSGAVVPGATVNANNLTNGQSRVATTDSSGLYTITQLPPGRYSISVSKQGFTTVRQESVELLTNQDLELNYALNVGAVTEQVTVTGAPPMLKTASGSLGNVVQTSTVIDLPLNGRQYTQLILLTPGAAPKESALETGMIPVGGTVISPSTNGQQGVQNTFTIDGVTVSQSFGAGSNINPPPDAIQEFNVQSHMSDAQYSISAGANISVLTKSGGPQLHASAWEFLRNSALDAANFFDNFASIPKPEYRQNQYGATVGGPVMLPGYDGRQKHTYFFGYWEGFRSSEGVTELVNVPTKAEEGGNFSDLLTNTQATTNGQALFDDLGRPIMNGQIYNPYSGRQVTAGGSDPITGLTATTTGIVRDPFPGNIMPLTMLNPQALAYLNAAYPAANFGPGGNNFPNYAAPSGQVITSEQFGVSLDHTFANNDTLNGKFFYTQPDETYPNALLFGTSESQQHARTVSLAYTHLFSPTLVTSVHFGYTRIFDYTLTTPGGTSLIAATNQSAILDNVNGLPLVPVISLEPRLTGTNQVGAPIGPFRTHEITADIQKIHGSHTFGVGLLYMHIHDYDTAWQTIDGFDQYPTSAISGAATNITSTGDGLASMLSNLPTSLTTFFGITAADMTTNWAGVYLQDKWQATRKLNIQFGLRWDFESPPHYAHNEFTMWNTDCPFGQTFTTAAQISAAEEQCLLMPVAYVYPPTPSNPTPPSWVVPNARSTLFDPKYDGWQPRFGFAYSLSKRTVVRGAFAIFDDHSFYVADSQDTRSSWPFGGEAEFSSLNDGLITPSSVTWSNPPNWRSFLPPESSTVVIARASEPAAKIPYAMEYNFGVEQQVSPNMSLSVNYVGSQDRHLWGCILYNQAYPGDMGPNAVPGGLPFPFIGGGIQGDVNIFPANYNALQAQLERRVSAGLSFLISYTYSKCMDNYSGGYDDLPDNTYDLAADRGVCDYDFTHIFSSSYIYQLPFGHGRHFQSGAGRGMDALIGGWNLGGLVSAHSGPSFNAYMLFDNENVGRTADVYPERVSVVPGCQLAPAGFQQNVYHWYNPACFTVPAPYTFGDSGRDSLRGPANSDVDFSVFKDFRLAESKTLEFRVETFNLLNHTNLAPPGANPLGSFGSLGGIVGTYVDTPTFMHITGAAASREIQFALKLSF